LYPAFRLCRPVQSLWHPVAALAAALPCFVMASRFLRVWRSPESVGRLVAIVLVVDRVPAFLEVRQHRP
jgi:hypothetical protein